MNASNDIERRIADYYATEAPSRAPDWILTRTLETIGTTPQRRTAIHWPFGSTGRDRQNAGLWRVPVALGGAAAVVVTVALALNLYDDRPAVGGPSPSSQTQSAFAGTWFSTTDRDGGTQTMTVRASADGVAEIVVRDDIASVCSRTPSTMTGTGRLEGDARLVIPSPLYTCDDGSDPNALSGPPLEEQLRNFTFVRDAQAGNLTDNFGGIWLREGAVDSSAVPRQGSGGLTPQTPDTMWPQSSLDEVQQAQERADAGDPAYSWQVDPKVDGDAAPWGAEIFARFIEEELGWEEFIGGWDGSGYLSMGVGGGVYEGVVFIRCAPGQTNPLSPLYADAPPEIRGCAPTIDELRYETVRLDVSQPGRRGPEGIWVVDRWEMPQSKSSAPGSPWGLLYPEFDRQVAQVVPPSDAEVTSFLKAFLRARVDGKGAEQYLLREQEESGADEEVPLLYSTTSETPYERSEIQRLQGPVWPNGWTEYKVRLFAGGETVVEQYFHVVRQENGQLGLLYGYQYSFRDPLTTENGQSVAVSFNFLDGEVTFAAPAGRWASGVSLDHPTVMRIGGGREHVVFAADPLPGEPGCENGPAPADAVTLARSIMAHPVFETTETVPVRIAGIDGLRIDGMVTAQSDTDWPLCYPMWTANASQFRMRLYLLDYPGESAQVLTIAVIAPDTDFERVLEQATPIVQSLEFHLD